MPLQFEENLPLSCTTHLDYNGLFMTYEDGLESNPDIEERREMHKHFSRLLQ